MKKELFEELVSNAKQAAAHSRGEKVKVSRVTVPPTVDVRAIRKKTRLTQASFADTFGFSLSGLKKWELGERTPEGPARVLLHMIGKDAAAVLELASR